MPKSKQTGATPTDQQELARLRETLDLLHAYGRAKFKDEWWPGNAQPHLGATRGARLEALLDA